MRTAHILCEVSVDEQAEAGYIRLGFKKEGEVLTTLSAHANLDVNERGQVVGIEILDWPVSL